MTEAAKTQTMSITRGLVELKRINDRINAAIAQGRFVARTVGKNNNQKVVGYSDTVVEMGKRIQASFDTVDALIQNRQKIKSAIVLSNATTKVTVLGQEMSVAEAIELKGTIVFRNTYLVNMRSQLMRESQEVEKANVALDAAIEVSLNTIYGSDKAKHDASTLENVSKPQKEQKEAALLDPAKIEERIAKLTKEIADLESEVDFTLSESNAKTTIEV